MRHPFKMLQKGLLLLGVNLFRLIPFPLLYRLSDGLFYILYYVARVRRSVVRQNLQYAFPHHPPKKIIAIEKKAYRNFCDIILETIKGYTLSPNAMKKRYAIKIPDVSEAYYAEKRSVIAFAGHYANWEWGISIQQHVKHKAYYVYKQLHNRVVDAYIRKRREAYGATLVHKGEMARTLLKNRRRPSLYVLVADQRPSGDQETRNITFFGRTTPCFAGPELMAKTFNYPVVYCKIQRIKRGYYQTEAIMISENPRDTADGEITQKTMALLEAQILEAPEQWMWMHRRFKGMITG